MKRYNLLLVLWKFLVSKTKTFEIFFKFTLASSRSKSPLLTEAINKSRITCRKNNNEILGHIEKLISVIPKVITKIDNKKSNKNDIFTKKTETSGRKITTDDTTKERIFEKTIKNEISKEPVPQKEVSKDPFISFSKNQHKQSQTYAESSSNQNNDFLNYEETVKEKLELSKLLKQKESEANNLQKSSEQINSDKSNIWQQLIANNMDVNALHNKIFRANQKQIDIVQQIVYYRNSADINRIHDLEHSLNELTQYNSTLILEMREKSNYNADQFNKYSSVSKKGENIQNHIKDKKFEISLIVVELENLFNKFINKINKDSNTNLVTQNSNSSKYAENNNVDSNTIINSSKVISEIVNYDIHTPLKEDIIDTSFRFEDIKFKKKLTVDQESELADEKKWIQRKLTLNNDPGLIETLKKTRTVSYNLTNENSMVQNENLNKLGMSDRKDLKMVMKSLFGIVKFDNNETENSQKIDSPLFAHNSNKNSNIFDKPLQNINDTQDVSHSNNTDIIPRKDNMSDIFTPNHLMSGKESQYTQNMSIISPFRGVNSSNQNIYEFNFKTDKLNSIREYSDLDSGKNNITEDLIIDEKLFFQGSESELLAPEPSFNPSQNDSINRNLLGDLKAEFHNQSLDNEVDFTAAKFQKSQQKL